MGAAVAESRLERAVAWLAGPTDAGPIAAARFGLGLTLGVAYVRLLPYADVFFGPRGIGGRETVEHFTWYEGLAYQAFAAFRVLETVGSLELIYAMYGLLIVAAFAFALGFRTKTAGVIAALLQIVFNAHNPKIWGGWAWLIAPFILYVVFCNPGRVASIDAWLEARRSKAKPPAETPSLPRAGQRMLMVHMTTMYLTAGFGRIGANGWESGEMVYRMVANSLYGRFDADWFSLKPLLEGATYYVYVLEPAAAFLLWFPRTRTLCAVMLIALHAGMESLTEAGFWQWMMISALMVFLPSRWFAPILRRLPGPTRSAG